MLKKFIEGLVFGTGFAIAFLAILYLAAPLLSPTDIDPQIETSIDKGNKASNDVVRETMEFRFLPVEAQISLSTVIAVARYEPGEDGVVRAIITEILKKDKETEFYYDIGQEFPRANYKPRDNLAYGDGVVIFFTGSPATMKLATSYSGGRLIGLADMPLDVLRAKCRLLAAPKEAPASSAAEPGP